MELTKEQISELAATAAQKVIEEMKKPVRTYVPGESQENPPEFKSFGEFLKVISDFRTGKVSQLDTRLKGLTEGTDSSGGYLVPEQYVTAIETVALETAIVRPLARKIPMTTDVLNYPIVRDESHASSVHGGVIAYWTEEAGLKKLSEPTFGRVKLVAKKLTGFTFASDELLEDAAIALEALLIAQFASAITWFEEEAFWHGNGVGQPLGIFNSGALVTPFRSTLNQVSLADLGRIMAAFQGDMYTPSVAWVANKSVLPFLIQLGSTVLTWTAIAGQKVPSALFGIPLYFSEHVATLGSVGDIGLYDFDKYLIGDRKGLKIDRSIEYRFNTDETTWRFVKRVDGQPLVDSTFTPKRGVTQSPFVCLASTTS